MTQDSSTPEFFQRFGDQAENPAAPEGMQYLSEGAQRAAQGDTSVPGFFQKYDSPSFYTDNARSWFTGFNPDGTNNGWATPFVDNFVGRWDAALANGTAREYFSQDDATGVVTWDHTGKNSKGETTRFKFGDVYEDGEYRGNVYDENDSGFDRFTGDLLMSRFLLDAETQRQANTDSNVEARYESEIDKVREDRNKNFESFLTSFDFQEDVAERAESLGEGKSQAAIVGGGALATAGLGAGVGSFFGPVGTAVGFGTGLAVGGIATFLNQDAVNEQAARAYEITSMAREDHGTTAAITTGVAQWSGFGGRLISPLSNLTQGSYDWYAGEIGDGMAEFHATDDQGQRLAPKWVRGVDLGASFADAALQFASPIGLSLYSTQMGGAISGQVGSLITTGGETFDYSSGTFDSIFTDDDGNFDAVAAAAGIGSIAIDAVQLGVARGLARKTDDALAVVGDPGVYATPATRLLDRAESKLPLWAGGSRGLAEGERRVRTSGWSMTMGADGAIVEGSRRLTLSVLAPSEFLLGASARVNGMRIAAREGRGGAALSADDFYRGAMALTEQRMANTIVNAMGEASEEMAQALLEPLSHSRTLSSEDMMEAVEAAAYGAAAGAGMTLATQARMPLQERRDLALAQQGFALKTGGGVLTPEEFAAMTSAQRSELIALPKMTKMLRDGAYDKIMRTTRREMAAGVQGAARLEDILRAKQEGIEGRMAPRTDQPYVFTQLENVVSLDANGEVIADQPGQDDPLTRTDAITADSVGMSLNTLVNEVRQHARGLNEQIAGLRARLAGDHADFPDPSTEQMQEWQDEIRFHELGIQVHEAWMQYLEQATSTIREQMQSDARAAEASILELNWNIRRFFNMKLPGDFFTSIGLEANRATREAAARVVSMIFVREPRDQAGSYQVLMPQVSTRLTFDNADHQLQLSHAILQAIGGDYDGDKFRPVHQLGISRDRWRDARAGMHYLGTEGAVNIGVPTYEEYNVEKMAEALGSVNSTLEGFALSTLIQIEDSIVNRYAGRNDIPEAVIRDIVKDFNEAIKANNPSARQILLDGLATQLGAGLDAFAHENLSNEWLWLDQVIVSNMQRFQESYAAHRPDLIDMVSDAPEVTTVAPHKLKGRAREVRRQKAATPGATLSQALPGDSLFRKFQDIHYVLVNAQADGVSLSESQLMELAMFYRELGQLTDQTAVEQIQGASLTDRVYQMIANLASDAKGSHPALNERQAFALMANLRVQDLEYNDQGIPVNQGAPITLAQFLLKMEAAKERRRNPHLIAQNPDMDAQLRLWEGMATPQSPQNPNNAELAFVEILGARQMFDTLGGMTGALPAHLSAEQYVRSLVGMSPKDRQQEILALQSDPAYMGSDTPQTMPYDLNQAAEGTISPYKAMVDAIAAAANSRVTISDKGKLSGSYVEASNQVSKRFREGVTQARQAMYEFFQLSPKDGELQLEQIERLFTERPDIAQPVMALMSDTAAAAGFRVDTNDNVYVANWLYEIFTKENPAEAEMHYWRGLMLSEWFSLTGGIDTAADADVKGLRYDKLNRRIHRVLYNLSAEPGKVALRAFMDKLENATDIDQFFTEMNKAGWMGDAAPLIPWKDDTADFDPDKAHGGWNTSLPMSSTREAMSNLGAAFTSLATDLMEERQTLESDRRVARDIRLYERWLDGDKDVKVTDSMRDDYNRLVAAIDMAAEYRVSLGPTAMLNQTAGAVKAFNAKSHTKGVNASNVTPAGMHVASSDTVDGYITNYERVRGSVTASNLNDLSSNLNETLRDGVRTVDENGRLITGKKPTPGEFLDLLLNPDTRAYAQAAFYPTVQERTKDGRLTVQHLHSKSLENFLSSSDFQDLFPRNDRLELDSAMRYLSQVEGLARKYGGSFSVQRWVNDIAIARTSGATHLLSDAEIHDMTLSAYYDAARVLQEFSAYAQQVETESADDRLDVLEKLFRQQQTKNKLSRAFNIDKAESDTVDAVLDRFIQDYEGEYQESFQELVRNREGASAVEIERIDREIAQLSKAREEFEDRLELLRADNTIELIYDRFYYDPEAPDAQARRESMTKFVLENMSVFRQSHSVQTALTQLTDNVLESQEAVTKLVQQLDDPNFQQYVNLSPEDWTKLSRAVIAVYIDRTLTMGSADITAPAAPSLDSPAIRYMDPTFSYLAEPLFRKDSTLMRAARELHTLAKNPPQGATQETLLSSLRNNIFNEKKLGDWTHDIVVQSDEANFRLNSSAAEPGIAIPGDSPKRLRQLLAGTKRSFEIPQDELLSSSTLNMTQLKSPDWTALPVNHGIFNSSMPRAQLKNRFARSVIVRARGLDGSQVEYDILASSPLAGRVWGLNNATRTSGLQVIDPDQLARAVERDAMDQGFRLSSVELEISFFHPDRQPVDSPSNYHNVFFEGLALDLVADHHTSLLSPLWAVTGAISPAAQAAALDASKKGLPAMRTVAPATDAERKVLEAEWRTDFARMLREKTRWQMQRELDVTVGAEYYNSVYKDMKIRHFVKGQNEEGANVLLTAEEVIQFQMENPGAPLPLQNAELWIPSDDMLRSLYGETGTKGARFNFQDRRTADPSSLPRFEGITAKMLEDFSGIFEEPGDLSDTSLRHRGRMGQLRTSYEYRDTDASDFQAKMRFLNARQSEIHIERQAFPNWDSKGMLSRAVGFAERAIDLTSDFRLAWAELGVPMGPKNVRDTELAQLALQDLNKSLQSDSQQRAGWLYEEAGVSEPINGRLTAADLNPSKPAYGIAPRDLVVVDLASFEDSEFGRELAKQRLDHFANAGAYVALVASEPRGDMIAELGMDYLQSIGYEKVSGSKQVFQPRVYGSRYQNLVSRASSLLATDGVSRRGRAALFLTRGLSITENAALIDADDPKLQTVGVVRNIIPSDFLGGFNVPRTPQQIEGTKAFILGSLNTDEGKTQLLEDANGHIEDADDRARADAEFLSNWTRLVQRLEANDGTVLPVFEDTFGLGDFIPLVNSMNQVVLYRHGFKAMDGVTKEAQLNPPVRSRRIPNVSVFPSKIEEGATVHEGVVMEFRPRTGYGLEVEMELPFSAFANKFQLEFEGIKYVTTAWNKKLYAVANDGVFMDGFHLSMLADQESFLSKEAGKDVVNNFRNAIAFMGMDFRADLAKFFFPGENATDPTTQANAVEILKTIAKYGNRLTLRGAYELQRGANLHGALTGEMQAALDVLRERGTPPSWTENLYGQDPSSQIATAMIVSVLAGVHPDSLIRSGGFNDTSASLDAESVRMPALFTEVLDNAPMGSPLRQEMFRRLNQQLKKGDKGDFLLHENWTFESRHPDKSQWKRGYLAFPEVHSSGDNPLKNAMSFDERQSQAVSFHSEAINYGAVGAVTLSEKSLETLNEWRQNLIVEQENMDGAGFWSSLTNIPKNDPSFRRAMMKTPLELENMAQDRAKAVTFRQGIEVSEANGWAVDGQAALDEMTTDMVSRLGMDARQKKLGEFWIRQFLGKPLDKDSEGNPTGVVTQKEAEGAHQVIMWNIEQGYLPVAGGALPWTHILDLQAIFRQNANLPAAEAWAPRISIGNEADQQTADSWDEWVDVAMGTALVADSLFDPMFLSPLNGFMHSYQGASRGMTDLPVSVDSLVAMRLMDPETNRMFVSISDPASAQAADLVDAETARASLSGLIGLANSRGVIPGYGASSDAITKRLKEHRRWRKENGIPLPVDQSMSDLRREGARFRDEVTTTNALFRTMMNLRVGMALVNPALYVSMGPEKWVRGSLDRMANLATGSSTAGFASTAHANLTNWVRQPRRKGEDASEDQVSPTWAFVQNAMDSLGLAHPLSPETLRRARNLYADAGSQRSFASMVHQDLWYLKPDAPGTSKWEMGWFAKIGSRLQDPTYGMKAETLARYYVEAALQDIRVAGSATTLTPESLITALTQDKTYLQTNFPEIHTAALNRIADIRSLKQTVLSKTITDIVNPMAAHDNGMINAVGNLVKIPLAFVNYAGNVATTVTGMQGYSNFLAAHLHGRARPGTWKARLQARAKGDVYTESDDSRMDYSSVLEGVDMHTAFIRGGLTHTGLFAFGLMAGGLGLSGETDEERKRRLMAENQGLGRIYDPREMHNDFRNADTLFLDNLPFGFGSWFTEVTNGDDRAPVQMHWMLKQFVSPVLGMERFFETGDFRQVQWGFVDALGAFPIINTMTLKDVTDTAQEVMEQANAASNGEDYASAGHVFELLTGLVGSYERMLFESSFVNTLYVGMDEYDRDPWVLPEIGADGELVRNRLGNTQSNEDVMDSYRDPETGEVRQGYRGRSEASAWLHSLTENRASLALVASLFTGGPTGSDYWRYNMPEKIRSLHLDQYEQEDVERIILQAWYASGGAPEMSVDDHMKQLRAEYQAAGNPYVTNEELRPIAEQRAEATTKMANLSSIVDGREVPTHEGAAAVFRGLAQGSLKDTSAALQGFYVDFDTRKAIVEEWTEDLVKDGIHMGLAETAAKKRATRLMYGDKYNDPDAIGLADIIWGDQISYHPKLEYAQLNTTYVMGPDGMPWATGFERQKLMGALGLSWFQRPVSSVQESGGSLSKDGSLNTVDEMAVINTGLRGLERRNETYENPSPEEIGKAIEEAIKEAMEKDYSDDFQNLNRSGTGYGYRRSGGSGGGGYSGSSGYTYSEFVPMRAQHRGNIPYAHSLQNINVNNPHIRRSNIRRERVWSDRGRLKQWQ